MQNFASRALFAITAATALASGGLLASCATSSVTTLYTPFTGLRLSSSTIFSGYTCGTGPGQIYAYAAVVTDTDQDAANQPMGLPAWMVYACGVNGAFQNLPGSGSYNITIYAYDQASFPLELGCGPDNDACVLPTGQPPPGEAPVGSPTWVTHCTGLQESGDNALVLCQPLSLSSALALDSGANGIDSGPDGSSSNDATVDANGDANRDSGVDAGNPGEMDALEAASSDVSDGANGDAGADGANSDAGTDSSAAADGANGEAGADAAPDGSVTEAGDSGQTDDGDVDGSDGS